MSFFLDDPKEAKKLKKELDKRMKDVKIIDLDKEGGDESNHVVYARLFEGKLTEKNISQDRWDKALEGTWIVYDGATDKTLTVVKNKEMAIKMMKRELDKSPPRSLNIGIRPLGEGKLTEAKESIFDVAAKVMKDQQNYNYKSKKGMVKLDMQTVNLLTQVFNKVNPKMKKYLSKMGEDDPA